MSEYRLFKVIRTDGQKYFDIEYVRDVVMCKECKHWNKAPNIERGWCDKCDGLLEPNFYCADGEREGE